MGEDGGSQTRERSSNVSISDGFSQLGCPPFLSSKSKLYMLKLYIPQVIVTHTSSHSHAYLKT